ncbi:MAG: tyrosine-type recombinase/integrase [Planctomycetaceae bacterium]|nr:tyrosine-type recombinase/integrase [Planctomycetaceae bacterium]
MANIRYLKDRSRWWVRWRATNRKTHKVFAGSQVFMEKAKAVAHWAEMEAQEKLWRDGVVETIDSIAEVVKDFADHCKQHSQRTQGFYRAVLGRFSESLPRNVLRIQQLDMKHIQEYLYRLRDSGDINRTLNAHLTAIKSFCRYFSDRYNLPNPASRVPMMREDPPDHRFLAAGEYEKLIAAAKTDLWRDRIVFLAHTGLRASEFCQLIRSGSLDPQASAVTITGKGRRRRTIPLNQHCREIAGRPYIYKPVGRCRLYMGLAKIAKRAKIPPLGPHALRHYCATQMLLKGVPIAKVAEVLGHSIRVCENTYKHFIPQDLQGTTDVLD